MKRANFNMFLILVIIFSHLTLSVAMTNIAIGLLVLSVLADSNIGNKLMAQFKSKRFWVLISPFLLFTISIFYSSDLVEGWKEIEIRLPLLIFPLVFGLVPLSEKQRAVVFKFFILLTVIIPIIGFVSQLGTYYETNDSGYFYNDHLVHYAGKQAAYFALYVNIALVGVFYFWQKQQGKSKLEKATLLTAFSFLVVIQYLLASRMALLVMLLLIVGFIGVQLFTNTSKKQIIVMFGGFVLAVIGLTILFPKVLKRFDSITHFEYRFDNTNPINHFNGEIKTENWNGLNTRLALWECALDVIKENPIIGTGIGDVQRDLVKNYKEKNFIFAIQTNYNTHNQYLDILLSNGILGLFVFLGFVVYSIQYAKQNKDWLLLVVLAVFLLSFVTENILNRNQGVVLFSLFIFMASTQPNNQKI
jgi:O-antigen ligase